MVSRAAVLDISTEQMDASTIELHGQLSALSTCLNVDHSLWKLSEGFVISRLASIGLLIMTTRTVAAQLVRSQASLSDYQARLTSFQSLPITELV